MPALTKAIAVELVREDKEGATYSGVLDKEVSGAARGTSG